MASIHKEILVDTPAESAWSAVRDVGQIHVRLVPGFVADCKLEGNTRIVTFANGLVVREPILDIDDGNRRHAWAAVGGEFTHYSASLQVFAEGADRCRLVWIADFLPDALAPTVETMIEQGMSVMKQTLERARG